MTAARRYWVTPKDGPPYRVGLTPVVGGWEAIVERNGERWKFPLAAGDQVGEAWSGERPIRYRWDAASGRLSLEGWVHALQVESEAVHRVAELGLAATRAGTSALVRAPMPGLVLALEVVEEEHVAKGQGLLIIEAMKMENEIRAPVAGVVRRISVSAGDAIERDLLLCVVEPPESA